MAKRKSPRQSPEQIAATINEAAALIERISKHEPELLKGLTTSPDQILAQLNQYGVAGEVENDEIRKAIQRLIMAFCGPRGASQ